MLNTFFEYFILFLIFSFIGWSLEITLTFIKKKKFVNRGFLIGPYCPIYGTGGIIMVLFLTNYLHSPIILFCMGVIISSLLEYITSYLMEKVFNLRWWDYSGEKYNIEGRVCLTTSIAFGLLGLFMMYVRSPFLLDIIVKIPENSLYIISSTLLTLFILDNLISFKVINELKTTIKTNFLKDNTEEITKLVLSYMKRNKSLTKRLILAFPNQKLIKKPKKKKKINTKKKSSK